MKLAHYTRAAALCAAALVATTADAAGPKLDAERLVLDPAARASLVVGNGEVAPEGGYRFTAAFQLEHEPLVLLRNGTALTGNGYGQQSLRAALVDDRLTLHLGLGWTVWDRLEVSAQVPVVAWQSSNGLAGTGLSAPTSFALGTPRLGARYALLAPDQVKDLPLSLGVAADLSLPIGSTSAYAGEDGLGISPRLEAGYQGAGWKLAAQGGAVFRTKQVALGSSDKDLGTELFAGAALATTGKVRLELSTRAARNLENKRQAFEQLAGVRVDVLEHYELFALGGPGFGHLAGTPSWRVLLGLARVSAKAKQAGPVTAAPVPVPVAAPVPAPVCPTCVACPDVPAVQPVPAVAVAPVSDWPGTRRVTLWEAVYFEVDRSDVRTESNANLDAVAAWVKARPEIGEVFVQGHADDTGAADYNRSLSLRRAHAVRDYLVAKGVPGGRVTTKGYGFDRPVDSDKSRNRRVDVTVTVPGAPATK